MSLYKRGNVYWADLRGSGGDRVSLHTGDLETAKARLEALQRPPELTLAEVIDSAWTHHYSRTKGSQTHWHNLQAARMDLGHLKVSEVTPQALREWSTALLRQGNANGTVNRKLSTLSKALKLAEVNVKVTKLREAKGRIRVITNAELDAVVGALPESMRGLVYFLVDTGARLSEALRITEVDRQVAIKTGEWTIPVSKNDEPRVVPLTQRALKALKEHSWRGLTKDYCDRQWSAARTKVGLQGDRQFVIHALRHTCASRLVRAGVSLYEVKALLGHSTIVTTERYAHLNVDRLRGAIGALEAL